MSVISKPAEIIEVFLDENFDLFLLVAIKFLLSKITLSDINWNSFDLNLTLFSKRIFSSLIKFPFLAVIKISLFFRKQPANINPFLISIQIKFY